MCLLYTRTTFIPQTLKLDLYRTAQLFFKVLKVLD